MSAHAPHTPQSESPRTDSPQSVSAQSGGPAPWRWSRYLLHIVLIAVLYGVLARLGFELAPAYYYVTSIWFPSGIGLAILLRMGLRYWPAMWLGPLCFTLSIGVPLQPALITGAGDMLTSLVGALMLRHVFHSDVRFGNLRDAALFIVFGAVLPPAIAGIVGASTLVLTGVAPREMLMPVFQTWWLADFAGAILLAPVLLTWPRRWTLEQERWRELLMLIAVVLLVSVLLLSSSKRMFAGDPLPNYIFVPLIIWAALRFDTAVAMLITLMASLLAIFGAHLHSVSGESERALQLLNMQVFNASLAMVAILLCAALNQLRAAADTLRRSEERFRRSFEYAATGVALVGLNGYFLQANQALCRMLGYSEDELRARHFSDLAPPADRERARLAQQQLLTGEREVLNERSRHVCRGGSELWTLLNVGVLRDAQGRAEEFIVHIQDITRYRRMEQEIETLNASLEQQVRERTAQLAATNHELEAFTWSVSHDMRAPLRAIDGFATALAEEEAAQLSDTGRGYLTRVRGGVAQLNELINVFLSLSRLGSATLHKTDVDLSAMATSVLADLAAAAPERQVNCEIAPGLHAHGDAQQMRVLLTNLLANAWKFTSHSADARIRFYSRECDGETVFLVEDNGAGFDMAQVDKLFTPFQRLHAQNEFEGSGIGLATCRRIIARHDGRLWAQGEPGKGATFFFTLGRAPL